MSLQVFLWSGASRTRDGKTYYNAFTLNGTEFRIGDCVFLYPEDEKNPHYVGRITAAFIDEQSGYKDKHCIEVKWYERRVNLEPHTKGIEESEREVFELEDTDINPIGCISGKCYIIKANSYEEAASAVSDSGEANWFFCRGYFQQSTNSFLAYTPAEMSAREPATQPAPASPPRQPVAARSSAASGHGAAHHAPQQQQQQHAQHSRGHSGHQQPWEDTSEGATGLAADDDDQHLTASKRKATGRACAECGATTTPQWREGPTGPKTLCNACGVRYVRNQQRAAGVKRSNGQKNGQGRPQELTPPRALHQPRVSSSNSSSSRSSPQRGTEQEARRKACPNGPPTSGEGRPSDERCCDSPAGGAAAVAAGRYSSESGAGASRADDDANACMDTDVAMPVDQGVVQRTSFGQSSRRIGGTPPGGAPRLPPLGSPHQQPQQHQPAYYGGQGGLGAHASSSPCEAWQQPRGERVQGQQQQLQPVASRPEQPSTPRDASFALMPFSGGSMHGATAEGAGNSGFAAAAPAASTPGSGFLARQGRLGLTPSPAAAAAVPEVAPQATEAGAAATVTPSAEAAAQQPELQAAPASAVAPAPLLQMPVDEVHSGGHALVVHSCGSGSEAALRAAPLCQHAPPLTELLASARQAYHLCPELGQLEALLSGPGLPHAVEQLPASGVAPLLGLCQQLDSAVGNALASQASEHAVAQVHVAQQEKADRAAAAAAAAGQQLQSYVEQLMARHRLAGPSLMPPAPSSLPAEGESPSAALLPQRPHTMAGELLSANCCRGMRRQGSWAAP